LPPAGPGASPPCSRSAARSPGSAARSSPQARPTPPAAAPRSHPPWYSRSPRSPPRQRLSRCGPPPNDISPRPGQRPGPSSPATQGRTTCCPDGGRRHRRSRWDWPPSSPPVGCPARGGSARSRSRRVPRLSASWRSPTSSPWLSPGR
jgi:hypothetical protein